MDEMNASDELVQMTRARLQNLKPRRQDAQEKTPDSCCFHIEYHLHTTLDHSPNGGDEHIKHPNTTHLKIICARVEKHRLECVLQLTKIRALALEMVRDQYVVDRFLATFGPNLHTLRINYLPLASETGDWLKVRRLMKLCPRLERLTLEGVFLKDETDVDNFPELREFAWRVSSEACEVVAKILTSPKLQKVCLAGAVNLDALKKVTAQIRERKILRQLQSLHILQREFRLYNLQTMADQFSVSASLAKVASAFLPNLIDVQFSVMDCLFSSFPFSPLFGGLRKDESLDKILDEFKKFNKNK
ncbi:uncharacterized protein LOC135943276 isoform X2 [Cloeon dipterum]